MYSPTRRQNTDTHSAVNDSSAVNDELVVDIIENMFRQESSIYERLRFRRCVQDSDKIKAWRAMLIEWMFQVVDFSSVRQETVGAAVFFFDLCLDCLIQDKTCRTKVQLAAATSLQLAAKTHDCKIIKHKDLIMLGRGIFTEEDLSTMECQIIMACQWHLHPTSVYCFLNQYKELLHVSDETKSMIYDISIGIANMTVVDTQYQQYPQSLIAYATMLVAMTYVERKNISTESRRFFCEILSSRILGDHTSTKRQCDENLMMLVHTLQMSIERNSEFTCLSQFHDCDSTDSPRDVSFYEEFIIS